MSKKNSFHKATQRRPEPSFRGAEGEGGKSWNGGKGRTVRGALLLDSESGEV